jgi:hypothetical protein
VEATGRSGRDMMRPKASRQPIPVVGKENQENEMATVIITAQVDDSANWEANFRTHTEIFRDYTATSVRYGTTDDNEVVTVWEVRNVDTMLSQIEQEETIQAMQSDGVNRDSVKVYVVDKSIAL